MLRTTAILTAVGIGLAAPAHAETALSALCAENAVEFQGTHNEMGLDPATWANDPNNLARFGFNGAGYTGTLYKMVISKGEPYIRSYWSNLTASVQWRCSS